MLFSPPCPQPTPPPSPVAAVSCFPSLVHYTTWSHGLFGQGRASGLGASLFLWHSQLCLLEEPARNCSQGGEISVSRWQINIFMWQIKALQLLSSGHELSPLKSEGRIPYLYAQQACQEAQGEVVEPTQNKESFRATVVACIHSTPGSVQWGRFDITVLQMLKRSARLVCRDQTQLIAAWKDSLCSLALIAGNLQRDYPAYTEYPVSPA